MVRYLILILSICTWNANSQVLDNRDGNAFTDVPFFNESFVKENKLKSLKGDFHYMKLGSGIRETEFKYVYEFDQEGHLISTFETRQDDGTADTAWNKYAYDASNNLTKHSKTEAEGFQTVVYTYDSLGRVIAEEYLHDILDSAGKVVRSLSFNKERIEYFDYDQQLKRTRYNNYDLPYLDEFFNYNELGYLVERIERIKMTSTVYTYHHEYNREGKLAAIRKSSNREEGFLEELTFGYDELGNLIEKKIYKKGELITDIQIIYSSKTKLLESVITTQASTGFMMILRFRDYEFFN